MRSLAFALLLLAAFAVELPWLDRAGVALAGLACLALAIGAAVPRVRRARPFPLPAKRVALPEFADEPNEGLVERVAAYGDREATA